MEVGRGGHGTDGREAAPPAACSEHAGRPALYRCDGCGRLLCAECSLPQSRLVVCAICGELAVPLPSGLPEEEPEATEAPPAPPLESRAGLDALLRYPLRGRQGVLLAFLAALLVGIAGLEAWSREIGCVAFLPFALLVVLFPGLLGDVTRNAAAGLGDLGEWPDYRSPGARVREALLFFLAAGLALMPASAILAALGCGDRFARGEPLGFACVALFAIALWPTALLWMSFWGVAATRGSLAEMVDLRALVVRWARAPHAAAAAATLGWAALLLGPALRALLPRGSVVGVVAEAVPGAWGALLSARAAGLLHRQSTAPPPGAVTPG